MGEVFGQDSHGLKYYPTDYLLITKKRVFLIYFSVKNIYCKDLYIEKKVYWIIQLCVSVCMCVCVESILFNEMSLKGIFGLECELRIIVKIYKKSRTHLFLVYEFSCRYRVEIITVFLCCFISVWGTQLYWNCNVNLVYSVHSPEITRTINWNMECIRLGIGGWDSLVFEMLILKCQ